jgi:hypothetical protein
MPQGDLDTCLRMADDFFEIACNSVDENILAAFETYRIYPIVVNYSFSCELYIKSLMMFRSGNRTFAKGHHLKNMIEKNLGTQDYSEILKRCKVVFKLPNDQALRVQYIFRGLAIWIRRWRQLYHRHRRI